MHPRYSLQQKGASTLQPEDTNSPGEHSPRYSRTICRGIDGQLGEPAGDRFNEKFTKHCRFSKEGLLIADFLWPPDAEEDVSHISNRTRRDL